jgi:hypothetical protein
MMSTRLIELIYTINIGTGIDQSTFEVKDNFLVVILTTVSMLVFIPHDRVIPVNNTMGVDSEVRVISSFRHINKLKEHSKINPPLGGS